eukprot:31481-Pelagococcus_subviridis.AAC.5
MPFTLLAAIRRAAGGSAAQRATVQRRPPLVLARRTLPQRLVRRPIRHARRSPVRIDVLLEECLPSLAVGVAPRLEVVRLAQRQMIRALRAPAGSATVRAAAHLRPPLVLARRTLPQRLVRRRSRHVHRSSVRIDVLLEEFLPYLAVGVAPHPEGRPGGVSRAGRAPGGVVSPRVVVHRRPPLVLARRALPQRLVARPVSHVRRSPVRIDVFLEELLPSLAVGVAPHLEFVRPGDEARAFRAPGGVVSRRAVAYLRPPLVLARRALPQRLVTRRSRHVHRSSVRIDVLLEE